MSWIKETKLGLWLTSLVLLSGVIYAILVVGDYILAKDLKRKLTEAKLIEKLTEAKLIEKKRIEEEDKPARKAAIAQGFKTLFYPDALERYKPLKALSVKFGVVPLAPQPSSRLYYCNEGYGLITYTADRFGFRNADNLWDEKKIDLVLIGDSFTHGACVIERDTIPGALPPRSKVLNLGTDANHPIIYAAIAKTFIPQIKPITAGIIFYANDNDDKDKNSIFYEHYFLNQATYFDYLNNGKMVLSDGVRNFYTESEPVIQRILNKDVQLGVFEDANIFTRAKKYFSLPNIRFQLGILIRGGVVANSLPFSSKLAIDTLLKVCESNGCKPIVVYIPNSEFWRPDPRANNYARLLSEYAKENKVSFVDTTESLRSIGESGYAVKGPHLSPKGYKIVADKIADVFKD